MKHNNLNRVKEVIDQSHKIVITTHVNPDGDGISSELALYLYLKKLGKKAAVVNRDPVPDIFSFLPAADEIHVSEKIPFEPDLLIITDCGEMERTGLQWDGSHMSKVAVIDHHLTNNHTGELNLLDSEASATGELVYDLIREMEKDGPVQMDLPIATCLYTSIFADTGSFRYSNSTPKAFSIASHLVSFGVNPWHVAEQVYESRSFSSLKLLGLFLKTLGVSEKGRFAWGTIRKEYLLKTGTRDEHTDGFVNYPRSIKGVEVAILFRENNENKVKVSMRSKGKVNVAAIAEQFGGGGHHNAAGCVMNGTLEEAQGRVLQIIADSLQDEVPDEYGTEVVGKREN